MACYDIKFVKKRRKEQKINELTYSKSMDVSGATSPNVGHNFPSQYLLERKKNRVSL